MEARPLGPAQGRSALRPWLGSCTKHTKASEELLSPLGQQSHLTRAGQPAGSALMCCFLREFRRFHFCIGVFSTWLKILPWLKSLQKLSFPHRTPSSANYSLLAAAPQSLIRAAVFKRTEETLHGGKQVAFAWVWEQKGCDTDHKAAAETVLPSSAMCAPLPYPPPNSEPSCWSWPH